MTVTVQKKLKPILIDKDPLNTHRFKNCINSVLMEQEILKWFEKAISLYQVTDTVPKITNPNSKWRVTSCMQKAIRRSDTPMAIKMASALVQFEPEYFLTRINVIALEDIGLANPILVASILALSGKHKTLELKYGLVKVAQFWVQGLSEGLKDRTLCDLMCMGELGPMYQNNRASLSYFDYTTLTTTQSIQDKLNSTQSFADKAILLRFMSGTDRYKGDTYLSKGGCYTTLIDFYWEHCPPLVAYIAHKGSKKSVYNLWQVVYISYTLLQDYEKIGTKTNYLTPSIPIAGIEAYGYDMHTQEGKRAYAYFAKSCGAMKAFLETHQLKFSNLAAAAFIGDSGLCSPVITYPQLETLLKEAYISEFAASGLTEELGYQMVNIIHTHIEDLNVARTRIVVGKN